jgi:hypothetical protein
MMQIGPIGGFECVFILLLLLVVAAISFRAGYFRGKK